MATIVLTAVGGAIGGPIGAALGAVLGGAVDRSLFRPAGREGPRLTELAVQTSSYGTPIPRLFGTMRVAGTVIWSTDLIEQSVRAGGGKNGPATTSYNYSASFAVLLSARPIRAVRRIWADGKLLRGAAGDFKTRTQFRLHPGSEDQAADPLIASAEEATPAHRGHAYAVFEGLPLAEFGNRIPSLTFEVEADAAPVAIGTILDEIGAGRLGAAELTTPLAGYAAYGASLRSVAEALAEAGGGWFAPGEERVEVRAGGGAAVALADAGASLDDAGRRRLRSIAPADTAPRRLSVQYHDPARDYQAGLQRADRPGAGARDVRIELPAAIGAADAKLMATQALARRDRERERRSLMLDWRSLAVAPGDRVTVAGEAGVWRVTGWALDAMVVKVELVRLALAAAPPLPATPGRAIGAPDRIAGSTILHAFEMLPGDDQLLSAPRLTVVAAGTGPGWRGAALQVSLDGGVRWTPAGSTRGVATLGSVVVAPGGAPATLVDRIHAIEVILAHDAMALADADDAALDAGANLAIVGDELLQFGRAEQVGPRRWRLTRLWRGRRGTEWASGLTSAGARFALVEPGATASIDLPPSSPGAIATVMAVGVGDGDDGVTIGVAIDGRSIVPPAPAALAAIATDGTAVELRWRRRSRIGWRWADAVDAPLGEEAERYRMTVASTGGLATAVDLSGAAATIDRAAWGSAPIGIELRQLGTHGPSRAASLILT